MFPKSTWSHQCSVEKNHCSKRNKLKMLEDMYSMFYDLKKSSHMPNHKTRRKVGFSSVGRRLRGFVADFKTGWSNWKIFFLSPSPSFSLSACCCLKMLFLQGSSRSMAVGRFWPRGVPDRWCEVLRFSAESLTDVSSGEHLRTVASYSAWP